MRLLIVRHADPEYSMDGLTEGGKLEAQALSQRFLNGFDGSISRLYSSPMGRARATAKYTEDALNMEAEVEDWTKELSSWGKMSQRAKPGEGGMALWDTPGEYLRDFTPSLTQSSQWELLSDFAGIKSSYEQLCAHSDAFLARHGYVRDGGRYRMNPLSRDVIVVFCHGGFGLTWLSHLLQLPLSLVWANFWLAPSSVTTVLFDERSADYATPRCIGLGDISHLYAAKLRIANSKYETPNSYSDQPRPSGVKSNFW